MNISLNITLVVVLIVLACMTIKGYKNGFIQEIISIFALGVAVLALALLASAIGNYITDRFGDMLIAIMFFVVLMIVANLSKLITVPVKFLSKLPVISWFNKVAGMCMGLVKGIICLWIFFIILNTFGFFGLRNLIVNDIERNSFLNLLYQHNYLLKFF